VQNTPVRRLVRVLALLLTLGITVGLGAGAWIWGQLRASLPPLDGSLAVVGLSGPVIVTRDALGIPTISGGSRADVARATGFLHGQDRFFQMDLSRRRAAGELAALVGAGAVDADREVRLHRFRAEAREAVSGMDRRWHALLDAYADGVNSGLASLRAAPFEYVLLRQQPRPWAVEDSMLVVLSMFITLQLDGGEYESTLATLHDVLPPDMAAFLAPRGTEWDTPLVGPAFPVPPIPGPEVYNLRARLAARPRPPAPVSARGPSPSSALTALLGSEPIDGATLGSNNWAVSGSLTEDGGALVANDMHLTIRVPNIWYRAALEWPPDGDPTAARQQVIGVTLPGLPVMVVGSNTHVAWGFTNAQADWNDIVRLELDPADPNRYRTPAGWRAFDQHDEVIEVAGEASRHERVRWTVWGPVIGADHQGRQQALRWVAHDAERLRVPATALESARTIEDAFDAVNGLGTPGQNVVVADETGRIGWTIYGSVPRRVGFDGRLPTSWADGSRGWNGWLDPSEYPRISDPESGRLWTANARAVDGQMLDGLGDGNYDVGARARIIRDRLAEQGRFSARDMLDIQLDTRAEYLTRWRTLLLDTLTPAAIGGHDDRRVLGGIVEEGWDGHAAADSAAFRLTSWFREEVHRTIAGFLLAECYDVDPAFRYERVRLREGPVWAMLSAQPIHLLDPRYGTWTDVLVEAVDAVIARSAERGGLAAPWWAENVAAYRHPLSAAVPFVDRWLDMPRLPLPGAASTPRMHAGAAAASERMVVSPGQEADGIMHMPTGQSGHPLSPFYGNSHPAWVNGDASPFLPGPTVHTLTLTPKL